MGPDRGEGGKFTPRVEDDDVVRALREHGEPVATAGDLASLLNVTSETVRRHLTELHEAGRVRRKRVGSRAVVWWLADEDAASSAPAAPLKRLVGMLDEEEADRFEERTNEVRDQFDREILGEDAPEREA